MKLSRAIPSLLLVVAILVGQSTAAAQDVDAQVATLVSEAIKLGENGNFAGARAKLLEAWELKQTFDIAANLAFAETQLADWPAAAEHVEYALRAFPVSGSRARKEELIQVRDNAFAKVGRITVNAEADTTIELDGKEVGRTPLELPLFLSPGPHTIVARKTGKLAATQELTAEAGKEATVAITLQEDVTTKPSEGLPSWPGWLIGGIGLAAAGAGAGLIAVGQIYLGDASDLGDDIRERGGTCDPEAGPGSDQCITISDKLASAGEFTSAGIGVAVTGGVLLIAGIVWLVIPKGDEPTDKPVAVVPWYSPFPDGGSSAGLTILGSF